MVAKRFFFVCAGLLCLAVAYHLGARNAGAQAPSNPVVASDGGARVFTANGDVYHEATGGVWVHQSNVFGGGPIPVQPETIGRLKARYR